MLKVVQLSSGDRLVQLRNPWGADSFKGKWSDTSSVWTDALAKEAGFKNDQKDGFIFMSIEDYRKQVEETYVNYDPEGMHSSYFLRLNDDGTGSTAGTAATSNTLHKLSIKSEVD